MSDRPDAVYRFGLTLAGVNLLTPPDRPAEFIAAAAVYPLPMAPRRLRGVMQLRGLPVLVFDADAQAPEFLPSIMHRAMLVIEDQPDSFAVLTDTPPRQVSLRGAAGPVTRPAVSFAQSLRQPLRQADDNDMVWWQADFDQLFGLLASDR